MRHRPAAFGAILLLAAAALSLTACDDSERIFGSGPTAVEGNGFVVDQPRPIGTFSRIDMRGVGTLYITQGARPELIVRAEENLLPYLEAEVRSGELVIWKDLVNLLNTRPIEFHLTVTGLQRVALSGAATVDGTSIDTGPLELAQTGAGDIRIAGLNASSVDVAASGVGEIVLSGSAYAQDVRLSNLTGYDGSGLQTVEADVTITNAGSATVRVSSRLNATINGSGSVYYIGDPAVSRGGYGSGEVIQIVE